MMNQKIDVKKAKSPSVLLLDWSRKYSTVRKNEYSTIELFLVPKPKSILKSYANLPIDYLIRTGIPIPIVLRRFHSHHNR